MNYSEMQPVCAGSIRFIRCSPLIKSPTTGANVDIATNIHVVTTRKKEILKAAIYSTGHY